jgi:hypothetical protein
MAGIQVVLVAHMKRTTVVLTDQLAALLDSERRRSGMSTAVIIREAVERYFFDVSRELPSFIGIVDSGGSGLQAQDDEEYFAAHWADDIARDQGPEELPAVGELNRRSAD